MKPGRLSRDISGAYPSSPLESINLSTQRIRYGSSTSSSLESREKLEFSEAVTLGCIFLSSLPCNVTFLIILSFLGLFAVGNKWSKSLVSVYVPLTALIANSTSLIAATSKFESICYYKLLKIFVVHLIKSIAYKSNLLTVGFTFSTWCYCKSV